MSAVEISGQSERISHNISRFCRKTWTAREVVLAASGAGRAGWTGIGPRRRRL